LTQADFTYSAFGLLLRSNLGIPGLVPNPFCSSVSKVHVKLGECPDDPGEIRPEHKTLIYKSSYLNEAGDPALKVWSVADGAILHLAYSDGMQFWLDRRGTSIWAQWPETSSLEDAATYLLGPVLGALLRIRGVICLHASAVAFEDQAVAFVGPPGAGKSTTAAILARRGCAVLSDDIVALAEGAGVYRVLPAYPYLSLWPDSVSMLYGSTDSLPRFIPQWEKRCLRLGEKDSKFQEQELPLRAIYLLRERTMGSGTQVESVSVRNAFLDLLTNSYAARILNAQNRAREFDFLARLVSQVPTRAIRLSEEANLDAGLVRLIYQT
jgi:hypothetical protein